ncbi:MAG TPA: site-specific integrase [Acidimicrobiia bacterium]|jgi:integrase|nr:site-specific integrase [Acidimicrobiia bacterium]
MKPGNAGKKYPAEPLTKDEVRRLLKACGRGYAGARNKALFVVWWRCGLRIAESLALHPKDVDLVNGTVTVLHGKGDRRRVVGIDPEAAAVVEHWLDLRRELGVNGRHPLFCVISRPSIGKPMHDSCAREAIKRAGQRAGLDRRVHPHALRHTHAFELAGENVPIHVIQKQLGHKDSRTTDRYIGHLRPQQVIDAMRARTWDFSHEAPFAAQAARGGAAT